MTRFLTFKRSKRNDTLIDSRRVLSYCRNGAFIKRQKLFIATGRAAPSLIMACFLTYY